MAVAGVLAEADIADDYQLRYFFLDCGDSPLDRTGHVPGRAADFILVFRQAEDFNRGDAERGSSLGYFNGPVYRQVVYAGHGGDFLVDILSGDDEKGIDEIRHGESGLANHAAERGADSQTTGTNL